MEKNLTVIIPAHNEEKSIEQSIGGLKKELEKLDLNYEMIVINDASTDKTKEILEKIEGIELINHPQNKGYGAALKTGIEKAKFNILLFFDADGQHKPEYIAEFFKYIDGFDMVTGARIGYKGPIIRQPGKKVLQWLANYLSRKKIPDLNCGFRLIKKEVISKFTHLLCDGFSFSTTTTLVLLSEGFSIKYVPVTINKREGKSKVRPKHAMDTFLLILRTILLFFPLRVFMPISALALLSAMISLIFDISLNNLSDLTMLLFMFGVLIFFFGLLADQISAIRREIKR